MKKEVNSRLEIQNGLITENEIQTKCNKYLLNSQCAYVCEYLQSSVTSIMSLNAATTLNTRNIERSDRQNSVTPENIKNG